MASDDKTEIVPVVEEVAYLEKKLVAGGKVTVRTVSETETQHLQASLITESVDVARVKIDRRVERAPPVRTEGDVTIISIVEERLIAEKHLFLVEEIRMTRATSVEEVNIPVELRRQNVVIER